jgi:hypothetical protein
MQLTAPRPAPLILPRSLVPTNFNAPWAPTRATWTPRSVQAPDGTFTAGSLVEDTSVTLSHYIQINDFAKPATVQQYRWESWVRRKPGSAALRDIEITFYNTGFADSCGANFDLTAGALGSSFNGTAMTVNATGIRAAARGWWYVTIVLTTDATSLMQILFFMRASGANAYTGDGASGILIWGGGLRSP